MLSDWAMYAIISDIEVPLAKQIIETPALSRLSRGIIVIVVNPKLCQL